MRNNVRCCAQGSTKGALQSATLQVTHQSTENCSMNECVVGTVGVVEPPTHLRRKMLLNGGGGTSDSDQNLLDPPTTGAASQGIRNVPNEATLC